MPQQGANPADRLAKYQACSPDCRLKMVHNASYFCDFSSPRHRADIPGCNHVSKIDTFSNPRHCADLPGCNHVSKIDNPGKRVDSPHSPH